MSEEELEDRLQAELDLLQSMYPDQIQWQPKARELSYTAPDRGSYILRIPSGYLTNELPEVLSANASNHKQDLRDQLKQKIQTYDTGEEILDSITQGFEELVDSAAPEPASEISAKSRDEPAEQGKKATVAVWLHHLLNTNKRKQALSPGAGVSGLTKPGYPGVLLYSGPAQAVYEHVNELKQLNWAAFQVRLEDDVEWTFAHGAGVKEVGGMGEVMTEVGLERKEMFMEAMRMK
ncbi:hypothetical protein MBLNU230_g0764t1 [Neophaeotheca triangularis]